MDQTPTSSSSVPSPEPDPGPDPNPQFYQQAFERMPRWIALVAILALPFVWWHGGGLWAASFLAGAIGGYWNYVGIRRIGDRLLPVGDRPGTRPSTMGFVLRLLFIAVAVFVIIRFTRINLVAAFLGLFTPVAAVVAEILYELVFLRDKS